MKKQLQIKNMINPFKYILTLYIIGIILAILFFIKFDFDLPPIKLHCKINKSGNKFNKVNKKQITHSLFCTWSYKIIKI